jgi:pentatricopeptide repeat protein
VIQVRRRIQQCCKEDDLQKGYGIYRQAKADGILIEPQSLYNLLNLCDGLGDRPLHIGTPKPIPVSRNNETEDEKDEPEQQRPACPAEEVNVERRLQYAMLIKQDMDDRQLPLNETAYTALIRVLTKSQRLQQADALLSHAEETQQCKLRLRLYSTLLIAYCQSDDLNKAVQLWRRLHQHGLSLTEREYVALLQCSTRLGQTVLLERVLSELAEDVLVPSKETVQSIVAWFQCPYAIATKTVPAKTNDLSLQAPPSNLPTILGPAVSSTPWIIDPDCRINESSGLIQTGCLAQHALQPVPLPEEAWQEMMQLTHQIVLQGMVEGDDSEFQGGGKGRKRHVTGRKRCESWNKFLQHLEETYKHGLDIVIDGANVGYYKQNYANAPKYVDYRQIHTVVKHFESLQKRVLVVLHTRHFAPNLMPLWASALTDQWPLYKASPGMNDDWFWLHAALWSRALVVTNDEMRDHCFQMLGARNFGRWKERHQIHFSFETNDKGGRQLQLQYPAKYSRRIQRIANGLVIPLTKRGDEHRYLDGLHVADDSEPNYESYVCIAPTK